MPDDIRQSSTDNPRATSGNNRPPVESLFQELIDELPNRLAAECKEMTERADALVANAQEVAGDINSEEQESSATDIISQIKKHIQLADSRRLGINSLPRKAKDMIDTFFAKKAIDPLQAQVDRITPGLTRWKRVKAENERREREERERQAREEAERQRQAAAEAERKRREAEDAKRRAEEQARAAEEAKRKAVEEARLAEERKLKAQEEERQAEERRKKASAEAEAAEARAKEATRKAAREKAEREAEAARRREEDEVRQKAEARSRADEEQRRKTEAQAQAAAERERQAAAKTEVGLAKGELADASRDAKTAVSMAKHAEGDANKATRAAHAKVSELSGARGDYGGQSSLSTRWVGDIVDRDKLDKNALWPFLTDEHLQIAVNAYVAVHKGTRPLKGANIYEDSTTVVR